MTENPDCFMWRWKFEHLMQRSSNPIESCMNWMNSDLFGFGAIRSASVFCRYKQLVLWILHSIERRWLLLRSARRAVPLRSADDLYCSWCVSRVIRNGHFIEQYKRVMIVEASGRSEFNAGTVEWDGRLNGRRVENARCFYRVVDTAFKMVYKVDISNTDDPCSCHTTHWEKIPCVHLMRVLREIKESDSVWNYVDSVYRLNRVSQTCGELNENERELYDWLIDLDVTDERGSELIVRRYGRNNGRQARRLPSRGENLPEST